MVELPELPVWRTWHCSSTSAMIIFLDLAQCRGVPPIFMSFRVQQLISVRGQSIEFREHLSSYHGDSHVTNGNSKFDRVGLMCIIELQVCKKDTIAYQPLRFLND